MAHALTKLHPAVSVRGVSVSITNTVITLAAIAALTLLTAVGDVAGEVTVPIIAALAGVAGARTVAARNGGQG